MKRYFTARGWVEDDTCSPDPAPPLPAISVHALDTGLVDLKGERIMRAPNPVGFGRDAEW